MEWGCSNQIHSPNSNNWPNKSQQRNSSLLKTRTTTRQLKPNIRIQWLNITCYFTNSGIILIQRHPLIGWWLPARTRNGSLCAMTRPESISISLCVCVCVCACSITKNKSSSVDAARGVHVQMYIVHNADTLARSLKCMYVFEFLPPQMHTNTRVCVRLRCWKIFVSNEYQ